MSAWKRKLDTMKHYDACAKVYDSQYSQEQKAKIEFVLKFLHLKSERLILDVGCGTCILFEYLLDKAKILVGIDISKNILREAKAKFKGKANIFLIQADADYLPFPNGVFDAVFAITLLQNMPSKKVTLKELKRVAKPNASILVTGLKKSFKLERFKALLEDFSLKKIWDLEGLKDYIALLRS